MLKNCNQRTMVTIVTRSVNDIWQKDERIERARRIILPKIDKDLSLSEIKYDPQDLEHQILFRMTAMPEKEAFKNIDFIFKEQKEVVIKRIKKARIPPKKLFVFGFEKDQKEKWIMQWSKNKEKMFCVKGKQKKEIVFREIALREERDICKNIIKNYHYIHQSRCDDRKGMMFGFYINGSKIPFAIEEVEPCSISRNYKKAILMMADINYHTCVELTRFYSVPNTPKNLISILDKLVGRALRDKGYEWMMTAVMPAFAKTKASTISGGIDTPLFAKELQLEFCKINGRYEMCVNRKKEGLGISETIKNRWKLSPVIEMIKPIVRGLETSLDKDKFYYIKK